MPEGRLYSFERTTKWVRYISLAVELVFLAMLIGVSVAQFHREPVPERINITLDSFGIFLLLMIDLSIVRSGERERFNNEFRALIFTSAVFLFSDGLFLYVNGRPEWRLLTTLTALINEFCPAMMTMIFWQLLRSWIREYTEADRWVDRLMQTLTVTYALLVIFSLATGWFFRVDAETGRYVRGPGYLISILYPSFMVLLVMIRILKSRESRATKLRLLVYPLVPYAFMLGQYLIGDTGASLEPLGMCCGVIIHFTNLYVRVEQLTAKREQALMESRLRSLQAQISPHFIYNALSSVASLCDSDPGAAQEMVYQLSDYLHDNFSDLGEATMIPFQEEIRHLEHYVSIEQVRFPRIRMEYDLKAVDFELPRTTLQPLVENAIKHGICKRKGSAGTIRVSSRETEDGYEIRVEDDGVGFEKLPEGSGHIGIANVRTRLLLLCDGRLTVSGKKGRGCQAVIWIPREIRKQRKPFLIRLLQGPGKRPETEESISEMIRDELISVHPGG